MKKYLKLISLFVFTLVINIQYGFSQNSILISFDEISQVLKNPYHADTIFIRDGIYKDFDRTIKNSKPVVILPQNKGKVTITGNAQIRLQSCEKLILEGFQFNKTKSKQLIKVLNSKDIQIKNNIFKETRGYTPYSSIIRLDERSSKNLIENNIFDNIQAMGIIIRGKYNQVKLNKFLNVLAVKEAFPDVNESNGMESIQIGSRNEEMQVLDLYTIVENNTFMDIIGDQMEVISVKSNKNTIRNNFFKDCLGAVTLRYGDSSSISDNIFIDVSRPIRIYGSDHSISKNIIINANKGIQIPVANIPYTQVKHSLGYNQQNNIKIFKNTIINSVEQDVYIATKATKERPLLPINIIIENNYIK